MTLETWFRKRYGLHYMLLCCLLVPDFVKSDVALNTIKIRCIRQENFSYKCKEIPASSDKIPTDTMMRLMEEKVAFYLGLTPEDRAKRLDAIGAFLAQTENNLFAGYQNGDLKNALLLASRLLNLTQDLATAIVRDLSPGNNVTIQGGKMLIFGIKADMSVRDSAKFQNFPTESEVALSDKFEIPFASLQGLTGAVPMSFIVHDRLGAWMTSNVSAKNTIVSRVITVLVEGLSGNLAQPINFTMAHLKQENEISPKCSFWQPSTKKWLSSGCLTEKVSKNYTSCSCNHLTSFAVLMDVTASYDDYNGHSNDGDSRGSSDDQGSGDGGNGSGGGGGGGEGGMDSISDDHVLSYITTVLLSISIVCLIFSLITFVCCKSLYGERNTIHINFVLCLGGGQLVFVLGIDHAENKIICAIIAGLLHFLFLSAFCWMLLEGLEIYRKLVVVFESQYSWTPIFYAIGYGVPTIIIAVSASVNPKGYGTPMVCWLSSEKGFNWSFIGPVIAILIFNMIMLCIAVRIMWHHLTFGITQNKHDEEKVSTMIKGSASLSVLLGTGWLFGVFQLGSMKIVMAYIFTLLNSAQGVFVFGFHCLGNSKVCKEYRKALRLATWIPMPVRAGLYKLVASPSAAEMELVSTSGVAASGTFSKIFRSPQEMPSVVTNSSIAKVEHPEQITQFPENSPKQNTLKIAFKVDSHEHVDEGSSVDPEEIPDENPEKSEKEKTEEAEKEKTEEAEKEKKDGDKEG